MQHMVGILCMLYKDLGLVVTYSVLYLLDFEMVIAKWYLANNIVVQYVANHDVHLVIGTCPIFVLM